MNETIRLGKVLGIQVGLNWTVLFMYALVAYYVGAVQLPQTHPETSQIASAALGVLAATLFLASILAHELAHAVVGRRNGLEVEGIVLWLLGGVSRLRGAAPSPGAELRISGVGPLTSLAIGVLLGAVSVLALATGQDGPLTATLVYLAYINVILAVFNLIPAAPLDGGRILRAALWKLRGDKHRAAVNASRAGRVFGMALIALGFVQLLTPGGLGGLWQVLLGVFIMQAAGAEENAAKVSGTLEGKVVRDVMTPRDGDVDAATTLGSVMAGSNASAHVVTNTDGSFAGIATRSRMEAVPEEKRYWTPISAATVPPDHTTEADASEELLEVLGRLQAETEATVVKDAGEVVGTLTPADVNAALAGPPR